MISEVSPHIASMSDLCHTLPPELQSGASAAYILISSVPRALYCCNVLGKIHIVQKALQATPQMNPLLNQHKVSAQHERSAN